MLVGLIVIEVIYVFGSMFLFNCVYFMLLLLVVVVLVVFYIRFVLVLV